MEYRIHNNKTNHLSSVHTILTYFLIFNFFFNTL